MRQNHAAELRLLDTLMHACLPTFSSDRWDRSSGIVTPLRPHTVATASKLGMLRLIADMIRLSVKHHSFHPWAPGALRISLRLATLWCNMESWPSASVEAVWQAAIEASSLDPGNATKLLLAATRSARRQAPTRPRGADGVVLVMDGVEPQPEDHAAAVAEQKWLRRACRDAGAMHALLLAIGAGSTPCPPSIASQLQDGSWCSRHTSEGLAVLTSMAASPALAAALRKVVEPQNFTNVALRLFNQVVEQSTPGDQMTPQQRLVVVAAISLVRPPGTSRGTKLHVLEDPALVRALDTLRSLGWCDVHFHQARLDVGITFGSEKALLEDSIAREDVPSQLLLARDRRCVELRHTTNDDDGVAPDLAPDVSPCPPCLLRWWDVLPTLPLHYKDGSESDRLILFRLAVPCAAWWWGAPSEVVQQWLLHVLMAGIRVINAVAKKHAADTACVNNCAQLLLEFLGAMNNDLVGAMAQTVTLAPNASLPSPWCDIADVLRGQRMTAVLCQLDSECATVFRVEPRAAHAWQSCIVSAASRHGAGVDDDEGAGEEPTEERNEPTAADQDASLGDCIMQAMDRVLHDSSQTQRGLLTCFSQAPGATSFPPAVPVLRWWLSVHRTAAQRTRDRLGISLQRWLHPGLVVRFLCMTWEHRHATFPSIPAIARLTMRWECADGTLEQVKLWEGLARLWLECIKIGLLKLVHVTASLDPGTAHQRVVPRSGSSDSGTDGNADDVGVRLRLTLVLHLTLQAIRVSNLDVVLACVDMVLRAPSLQHQQQEGSASSATIDSEESDGEAEHKGGEAAEFNTVEDVLSTTFSRRDHQDVLRTALAELHSPRATLNGRNGMQEKVDDLRRAIGMHGGGEG